MHLVAEQVLDEAIRWAAEIMAAVTEAGYSLEVQQFDFRPLALKQLVKVAQALG